MYDLYSQQKRQVFQSEASLASGPYNGHGHFKSNTVKKDDIYPHHPLSDADNF